MPRTLHGKKGKGGRDPSSFGSVSMAGVSGTRSAPSVPTPTKPPVHVSPLPHENELEGSASSGSDDDDDDGDGNSDFLCFSFGFIFYNFAAVKRIERRTQWENRAIRRRIIFSK